MVNNKVMQNKGMNTATTAMKMLAALVLIAMSLCGCRKNSVAKGFDIDIKNVASISSSDAERHCVEDAEDFSSRFENDDIDYSPTYARLKSNKYYDHFFGDLVTVQDVVNTINGNKKLNAEFKELAVDFVYKMYAYYGDDLELRVFNMNMQDAEVITQNPGEIGLLGTVVAKYNYEENTFIIPEGTDYSDLFFKLVLRHELGHALNSYVRERKDGMIKVLYCVVGSGKIANETMDVVLTTQPFLDEYSDEMKQNMGYGMSTNVYRIILDVSEYQVVDGTRRDIEGLKEKLSNCLPAGITTEEFLKLYDEFSNSKPSKGYQMPTEDLREFYTILTQMYISKHVTSDMSASQIDQVKEQMETVLYTGFDRPDASSYDVIDIEFDKMK